MRQLLVADTWRWSLGLADNPPKVRARRDVHTVTFGLIRAVVRIQPSPSSCYDSCVFPTQPAAGAAVDEANAADGK